MYELNLPQFEYNIKTQAQKKLIFDIVRKKYVALTPEEWVRQHVIHYLVTEKKVPVSLISVEKGFTVFERAKRSDVVVFSNTGNPVLLVECKAPNVSVSQKTLQQAGIYNLNFALQYLMITNGHTHLYTKINRDLKTIEFIEELPLYPF